MMTDSEVIAKFDEYRQRVFRMMKLFEDDRDAAMIELGSNFRLIYEAPNAQINDRGSLTYRSYIESFCEHIIPDEYEYIIDLSASDVEAIRLVRYTPAML